MSDEDEEARFTSLASLIGVPPAQLARHIVRPLATDWEVYGQAQHSWRAVIAPDLYEYLRTLILVREAYGYDANYPSDLGQVRGPQLAQAYTRRGFLRRETNPSLALVDYDSALRIQTSAEALTGRAWISMNRREYDVALTDLGKAIDMSPAPTSAALARYYRGYALLRLGNYPQAQMDLGEAIRLQPDIADYYLARGEAQQGLKALDAALRDADEFSRRAPKDNRGLVLRGAVLEAMGKPQEALAAFESAVALSPNDDYAVSERDRLREQKGPQGKGDPAK